VAKEVARLLLIGVIVSAVIGALAPLTVTPEAQASVLAKLRRVGGSVMVMAPKVAADALGLKGGNAVDLLIRSLRDHVRPEIKHAAETALSAAQPGLDVPHDR
jgi:antitoxin component of MazEF toxin-antitoxin module